MQNAPPAPDENAVLGAQNMRLNCANARSGERLLIAYEPASFGYYESDAVTCVTAAADRLNLETSLYNVGFSADNPRLTPELHDQFAKADIILFLARLGDQLRFSEMSAGKRIIVSFALSAQMFGSGFGNAHHHGFLALKGAVNNALDAATHVHVTCRYGTDFTGTPKMNLAPEGDTSILRFPMSVFTPVPAHTFTGKVSVSGFLSGTGSMYYDPSTVTFDGPVLAVFDKGRLTGFTGGAADVNRANQH